MEFLNINSNNYAILEIYQNDTNPSNDDDINDSSHWIQVSMQIILENPGILSKNLTHFITVINELFSEYKLFIKTHLEEKFPDNSECLSQFDDCFQNGINLNELNNFTSKYKLDVFYLDYINRLFNITTIISYVDKYFQDTDNMNIIRFTIERE